MKVSFPLGPVPLVGLSTVALAVGLAACSGPTATPTTSSPGASSAASTAFAPAPNASSSPATSTGIPSGALAAGTYETAVFRPTVRFNVPPGDAGFWRGSGEMVLGFSLLGGNGAVGVLSLAGASLSSRAVADALVAGLGLEPGAVVSSSVDGHDAFSIDAPARTAAASFSVGGSPLSFRVGERNRFVVVNANGGPILLLLGAQDADFPTLGAAFERLLASLEI